MDAEAFCWMLLAAQKDCYVTTIKLSEGNPRYVDVNKIGWYAQVSIFVLQFCGTLGEILRPVC